MRYNMLRPMDTEEQKLDVASYFFPLAEPTSTLSNLFVNREPPSLLIMGL